VVAAASDKHSVHI